MALSGCFRTERAVAGRELNSVRFQRRVAAPARAVAQPRSGGTSQGGVPTTRSTSRVQATQLEGGAPTVGATHTLESTGSETGATAVRSRQVCCLPISAPGLRAGAVWGRSPAVPESRVRL